ncbi:MAG TPA: cyclic nucleotide-binding domain-containing protein [Thermoanaerobaculia bacterium]|jgi:CRP-like cAMP-binding protein|nr:cyclic nucleotide-binding domain-containing protein [Thermoanaerobaculia bacterium]
MAIFDLLKHERDLRDYAAGDVIFTEGDAGDSMYAVLEGDVEITKHGHVLEVVPVGGVFGEMALIDQEPRSATAKAQSACKLALVNQKRFTLLVQQTPFFALQIMHILADRLRRNTNA